MSLLGVCDSATAAAAAAVVVFVGNDSNDDENDNVISVGIFTWMWFSRADFYFRCVLCISIQICAVVVATAAIRFGLFICNGAKYCGMFDS